MNEQEFNNAYNSTPESIDDKTYPATPKPAEQDPKQAFDLSRNALEAAAKSVTYAGRIMIASAAASATFTALTVLYAQKDDPTTAGLSGIIAAGLAVGAAYARHRAGQYLNEETRLRVEHCGINAAHQRYLKEQDQAQRAQHLNEMNRRHHT